MTVEVHRGAIRSGAREVPMRESTPQSGAGNEVDAASGYRFEGNARRYWRGVCVVVPFYKNAHLVQPLFESLVAVSDEIAELGARILFINDSPGHAELERELLRCNQRSEGFRLDVQTNPENLGFVGAVNSALLQCRERREDVILLNSDTYVLPGALREMRDVAYSDPLIGFVSPRSNNATICTLPASSADLSLTPQEAYTRYLRIRHALPRITYVPTAVGFCLYIKGGIIEEFGVLDPVYGAGYNEENDYIMRANRCGYRATLANRCFVWHQGETSFSSASTGKLELERRNAALLAERYPEYPGLVGEYVTSPYYKAERLLNGLVGNREEMLRIAFDFTNVGLYHCGTFEAAKRLLSAATDEWPERTVISVIASHPVWDFHLLGDLPRVERVDPETPGRVYSAIVRVGQPFSVWDVERLVMAAPIVSVFMLDPIAADCGNLRCKFNLDSWRFVLEWADNVSVISGFIADEFQRRFYIGPSTDLVVNMPSLSPTDYTAAPSALGPPDMALRDYVLVIGNAFAHKAVLPAVEAIAALMPDRAFVALGCPEAQGPNVIGVAVGKLSDSEIDAYYANAAVVVFPTHYEGFGFPLLHGLARNKPVIVRDLPVFREIVSSLFSGRENVTYFGTLVDLQRIFEEPLPSWVGPGAEGEERGWARSARQLFGDIERRIARVDVGFLERRIRALGGLLAAERIAPVAGPIQAGASTITPEAMAARKGGRIAERALLRLFRSALVYRAMQTTWATVRSAVGGKSGR